VGDDGEEFVFRAIGLFGGQTGPVFTGGELVPARSARWRATNWAT